MSALRWAVVAGLVLAATVIQTALLSRSVLPGPTPDLVALVVIGVALTQGANAGAIGGFGAGLLLALVPPAVGPIGLAAMGYAVVGYLVGSRAAGERLARGEIAGLAAAVGASVAIGTALVGGLWGEGWMGPVALVITGALQATYCAALAVVVTPAVGALVSAIPGRYPV